MKYSVIVSEKLTDSKKINRFKIIKKAAGKDIQMLSFNFSLTAKPQNISSPSPREDIVNIRLNLSPTNNPVAPKNSKIIVNSPNFSKLNRLNSFFI